MDSSSFNFNSKCITACKERGQEQGYLQAEGRALARVGGLGGRGAWEQGWCCQSQPVQVRLCTDSCVLATSVQVFRFPVQYHRGRATADLEKL